MLKKKQYIFRTAFLLFIVSCNNIGSYKYEKEIVRKEPIKPLMKDFMGLNVHLDFKPDLYKPITHLVRNYHPMNWDVASPGDSITFPICVNQVNWDENAYGKWNKFGYDIDVSVEINPFGPKNTNFLEIWKNKEQWEYNYGYKLAKYFGPLGDHKLITSIEIGNEPGINFTDSIYMELFKSMARGIRSADSTIKIVTCNTHATPADEWTKNLNKTFSSQEIRSLFDVISFHSYTIKDPSNDYSPWERSYPEDEKVGSYKNLEAVINWRNSNAPDKEIWVTEFGWDAVSDDMMDKREGYFKELNWQDVTDLQQAQYLVRTFLCFSAKDVQRAYIYFYNDKNQPSVHAASGITRNFKPKKSFWAVKHLYKTLGEYRFNKVIEQKPDSLFIYEYKNENPNGSFIWVMWIPDSGDTKRFVDLHSLPGKIVDAAVMQTGETQVNKVEWKYIDSNTVRIENSESPTYIIFKKSN